MVNRPLSRGSTTMYRRWFHRTFRCTWLWHARLPSKVRYLPRYSRRQPMLVRRGCPSPPATSRCQGRASSVEPSQARAAFQSGIFTLAPGASWVTDHVTIGPKVPRSNVTYNGTATNTVTRHERRAHCKRSCLANKQRRPAQIPPIPDKLRQLSARLQLSRPISAKLGLGAERGPGTVRM